MCKLWGRELQIRNSIISTAWTTIKIIQAVQADQYCLSYIFQLEKRQTTQKIGTHATEHWMAYIAIYLYQEVEKRWYVCTMNSTVCFINAFYRSWDRNLWTEQMRNEVENSYMDESWFNLTNEYESKHICRKQKMRNLSFNIIEREQAVLK